MTARHTGRTSKREQLSTRSCCVALQRTNITPTSDQTGKTVHLPSKEKPHHMRKATCTRPQAQGHRHKATGTRSQAQGHRRKATCTRPQAQSHRHKVTGARPQAQGHKHKATRTMPHAHAHDDSSIALYLHVQFRFERGEEHRRTICRASINLSGGSATRNSG